jgi:hypothetical protein
MAKKKDSVYDYIHLKLLELCKGNTCISYGELSEELIYIRISKKIIPSLIKELEENGVLNKINQRKFEINKKISN